MTSGDIGAYKWTETVPSRATALFDTLRALTRHLVGLRAVKVSWDSGLFVPSDDERAHGWTIEEDHAVSPVIDDDHFITAAWAEDDLARRRLKISRFDDLDDPFELLAAELRDPAIRRSSQAIRTYMSERRPSR
jgi:hypothetical protein